MRKRVVNAETGRAAAIRLRRLGSALAAVTLLSATSAGIAVPSVATAMNRVARSLDALGVLAARSPGAREAGAYSIKGRRTIGQEARPRDAFVPDSTANNGVAYPRVFDLSADQAPIPAALGLPEDLPPSFPPGLPSSIASVTPAADVVANASGLPSSGNGIIPGGTPGSFGGGGVPPIGPNNPTKPPSPPPPVPPAVPEPSGWAMMITAFFLIGGVIRMRNRRKAAA